MTTKPAVKERPIIFSGPMVRAILDGSKTQTRRVVKPQPDEENFGVFADDSYGRLVCKYNPFEYGSATWVACESPYGQPGDRLWVKETWRVTGWRDGEPLQIQFHCDNAQMEDQCGWFDTANYDQIRERIDEQCSDDCRQAGLECGHGLYEFEIDECPTRWRSPRFIPRWASRIARDLTDVCVERVQAISEEDAQREGVKRPVLIEGPSIQIPTGPVLRTHPMTGFYRVGFQ